MIVGLPQGLLYHHYNPFFITFFEALKIELIISSKTSKSIVSAGLKNCTNESCLPIKIFHGHVEQIKSHCDLLVIPRIMKVESNEYLCPHMCGLPEMIVHSLDGLPRVTREPLYFNEPKKLLSWSRDIGHSLGKNKSTVDSAFYLALTAQEEHTHFTNQHSFPRKILLLGHRYTIEDPYLNMDLVKRLNAHNIGVITSGAVSEKQQNEQLQHFTKKPFWYDFRQAYSSAAYLSLHKEIDGIIYLTSFGCGMDTIIIEVIREDIHQLPFLVVKLDEHTGDAGLDTRLEAFSDMLERRLS